MKKVRFNGNENGNSNSNSGNTTGEDDDYENDPVILNDNSNGIHTEADNNKKINGDKVVGSKKNFEKVFQENHVLRVQLEKALRSIQLLEFQLTEKSSQLDTVNETLKNALDSSDQLHERSISAKDLELLESQNMLVDAESKIMKLKEENDLKSNTIDELHKRLSDAFEAAVSVDNNDCEKINKNGNKDSQVEDLTSQVEKYEVEIAKLEQKLINSNEEKEYYKKHHQSGNHNNYSTMNNVSPNSNAFNDEFGRELMVANKRKYQLESKVKQMEHEITEAQAMAQHFERTLKNTEKLLWLAKERSSTLENELSASHRELNDQRFQNEQLSNELDRYHSRETSDAISEINDSIGVENKSNINYIREMENLQKDYDAKITDLLELKAKSEWRLGEVTQNWHDAKWRVGELESTLAHKEHEIDQHLNRIKELEGVLATPVTHMNGELERLRREVTKILDEKSKVEWRLGEVTQFWNDAKWRVGEMEGEINQLKYHLDESRRRNHELENSSPSAEVEAVRREKSQIEWRFGEINQMFNDAKWRIGELEAELSNRDASISDSETSQKLKIECENLRRSLDETCEHKSKVEWRLGEVTQYWNDAKWRIGELQELLNQKENELKKSRVNSENSSQQNGVNLADLTSKLNESFILKKQPRFNRQKWNTVLWENSLAKDVPLRRVWFEVDAKNEVEEIFLIGSFLNWECALLCEHIPEDAKRRGLWVDLPVGRHEFRFISEGQWHTASNYPTVNNEFMESNNWRNVE